MQACTIKKIARCGHILLKTLLPKSRSCATTKQPLQRQPLKDYHYKEDHNKDHKDNYNKYNHNKEEYTTNIYKDHKKCSILSKLVLLSAHFMKLSGLLFAGLKRQARHTKLYRLKSSALHRSSTIPFIFL